VNSFELENQLFESVEGSLHKILGGMYFVGCSSGTAALHLALEALKLPKGSEVIVPDYTMIACPRAVVLAGLTPVFADCREDLQVNPNNVERLITPNTKAIMAVHVYGKSCDMKSIMEIAKKYDLRIIEDLAEAHLLPKHPDSDMGCFSFYKNKLICGEEGGGINTDNDIYRDRLKELRCLGFQYCAGLPKYEHKPRGHNYRLSNAHAGIILTEGILKLDERLAQMKASFEEYHKEFSQSTIARPVYDKVDSPWVFPLRIRGISRILQTRIVTELNNKRGLEQGVSARVGFWPMVWQEEFRDARYRGQGIAWGLASEVIYLPLIPQGNPQIVRKIIEGIVRESV
jgi:dTDP-4-amino-4,6-dideoxygalactose transaminase